MLGVTDSVYYEGIADAVREGLGTTEEYAPSALPEKVGELYDAGKQAEYDVFWDAMQENGNRTDYRWAFAGVGWNNETFKPKYDIKPSTVRGAYIFQACGITGDLVEILNNLGVSLDWSETTSMSSTFNSCYYITRLGVIGNENVTSYTGIVAYCSNLKTIDKIIIGPDATLTDAFRSCPSLENLTVEGTIGTSIAFGQSTVLSKESITSVMNALSTTASGQTATFSETAVIKAFGGTDNAEWVALVNTRTNWSISLV